MKHKLFSKTIVFLIILMIVGGFLRFYKLNWGEYYFHPDEHNIVYSVTQLTFPDQWHPDFFAYGSLPIYNIFLTSIAVESIMQGRLVTQVDPTVAIIVARALSALFATMVIPLTFLLLKKMFSRDYLAFLGTVVSTFFIGYLQYAHFATFEMWQTFIFLVISLMAITTFEKPTQRNLLFLGMLIGAAISIKVSNAFLIGLPYLVIALHQNKQTATRLHPLINVLSVDLKKLLLQRELILTILVSLAIFFITNPFSLLDPTYFVSAILYESNIATGAIQAFYTRGFLETRHGWYQLTHVFPFISGYFFTLIATIGAIIFFINTFVKTKAIKPNQFIFWFVFGGYLFLNILLYVKWTRYMIPALPLATVGVLTLIDWLDQKGSQIRYLTWARLFIVSILLIEITLRGLNFFAIYTKEDPRYELRQWIRSNLKPSNTVLIEDREPNSHILLSIPEIVVTDFDFYALDPPSTTPQQLAQTLYKTDYLVISSQRVWEPVIQRPVQFPIAHHYYQQLHAGALGFEAVYSTEREPCWLPPDTYTFLLCPTNQHQAEQTFSVFDQPAVTVYQKMRDISVSALIEILMIRS